MPGKYPIDLYFGSRGHNLDVSITRSSWKSRRATYLGRSSAAKFLRRCFLAGRMEDNRL